MRLRLLVLLAALSCTACGEPEVARVDVREPKGTTPSKATELDRQVVAHMTSRGANLSKPTDIRWFVYFTARKPAEAFADLAAGGGWTIEKSHDADDGLWLVRCNRDAIVSLESVPAMRNQLNAWAESRGGEIDGWEAAIQK